MFAFIKSKLEKMNIDLISCISLDECEIIKPYLLEKQGIKSGSVIIFAVPYFSSCDDGKSNISAYAQSRDYHLFFSSLFENLLKELKEKYPENKFVGFTDHSPINEIKAAAKSGLGVLGKNHLLITEKYSSFIFVGEIITDADLESHSKEIENCDNCGLCQAACPIGMEITKCLSSITQKKGDLTVDEIDKIKKHGCAWGCDICQNVCPHTKKAFKNGTIFTEIDFFKTERTPFLTSNMIEEMSDEEFSKRAYSWRGKKVIKRNLTLLEGGEK